MKSSSKKSVHARTLTFLTASFLFLSLTGCSDTDDASPDLEETTDPKVLDTPETSDTPEYVPASEEGPAQNVPEPRLPAVATERTEDGALEALEYFWDSAQYARLTGDLSPFEMISSESCEFCASFAKDWGDAYKSGQWALSEGHVEYEVVELWLSEDDGGSSSADILFTLKEPNTKLFDSNGEVDQGEEKSDGASDWFALLLFDSTAQRWKIEWIGLEELVTWEE